MSSNVNHKGYTARVACSESEFDEQMRIGRQIMDECRDVLRELAK